MQISTGRFMIGLCATLLFSLPLAVPPAQAGPTPHSQPAASTSITDITRSSALSRVASLEGSVHAVGVSGALAYVVAGHSLLVIDISNPTQPNRLASMALEGGDIYNLQVAGTRAYLTSIDGVLRIVDIHDPQRPTLLSTHELALMQLQVVGELVYAIVQDGSLRVFDVSNPLDVRQISSYAPASGFYPLDLQVTGGLAYVASYDSGFQIVDLRDLSHPRLLGRLLDRYFMGISVSGSRAYLIRRIDSGLTYLDVIDISQPSRPKRLGSLQTSALRDLQVAGSLVYAVGDDGLYMIDVSKPAAPRQTGVYPLNFYPIYSQPTLIAVAGSLAYVAGGESGLEIIDVTNPALPRLQGQYITLGTTYDVQIVGDLAYIASGSRLRIFDISDPARPTQRGSYFLYFEFRPGVRSPVGLAGLQIHGNLAYMFFNFVPPLCCQVGGMEILDISDPAHPISRGRFTNVGINDIQVVDQRVYLTGAFLFSPAPLPVLSIIDTTSPVSPTLLGTYGGRYFDPDFGDSNGAAAVDVAGSLAYVADFEAGLKIIDVSNPVSPTLRSRLDTPGNASDIQVAGNMAYIADGERGLLIVDVSNPNSPSVRGSFPTPESAVGLRVAGGLAYVATMAGGVQVVDISDPARPIPRGRYDTPGYAQHIDVAGDLLYVADQAEGLQILKLTPLPSVSATIPINGGTLTSAADNTSYTFATGTFTSTAVVTHTIHFSDGMPPTGSLAGGHAFDVLARDSATGQLVQPTKPYSITVQYGDADRGPAIESTLALYFWDGSRWIMEPSSRIDLAAHSISATSSHFSLWAVLGETRHAFLPAIRR